MVEDDGAELDEGVCVVADGDAAPLPQAREAGLGSVARTNGWRTSPHALVRLTGLDGRAEGKGAAEVKRPLAEAKRPLAG